MKALEERKEERATSPQSETAICFVEKTLVKARGNKKRKKSRALWLHLDYGIMRCRL
jgi:hypothetical protein